MRYLTMTAVCMLVSGTACDSESDSQSSADTPVVADVTAGDTATADASADAVDTVDSLDPQAVGPTACCLTVGDGIVVWADAGDIWAFTPALAKREKLVEHAAIQKDPVIEGTSLVWADDRNGDFDLWTMDLTDRVPSALVEAAGDQDQPVLSGDLLAFVSRVAAPHTDREADIWMLRLGSDQPASAVLVDAFEQTQPHVSGDRIVWADFTNAIEGQYVDFADPAMNNADIRGWDDATAEFFTVSDHPSKQLRPAIDGEEVVWMDWRDVNPEPKYSEFQIYGKALGDVDGHLIAWSSWAHPELWQRPALHRGVVAWIAEPVVDGFVTGVFAKPLSAPANVGATLVTESQGVLNAVVLRQDQAAWLGAGRIDMKPLDLLALPGR